MANTGNIFPTVGANNNTVGVTAWTNPGNIVSDNATDATCNAAASSQDLQASGFGFSIPSGATINGVVVRIEASEHSGGTEELFVRLAGTGTTYGSLKSVVLSGTAKTVYTLGATNDVWGATLTPAIVNDSGFGTRCGFTTAHDVRIDFITIAIEYTVNAPQLDTEVGVYSTVGSTVELTWNRVLDTEVGSYSTTGNSVELSKSIHIDTEAGVYSTSGNDVGLTWNRVLDTEAGVYSTSGNAVDLLNNRVLDAEAGSYSTVGNDVELTKAFGLAIEEGSYSTVGSDVSLEYNRILPTEAGVYSTNGQDVEFLWNRTLTTEAGVYLTTGNSIDLTQSGGNPQLDTETGVYLTVGSDVELLKTYVLDAEAGSYQTTGNDVGLEVGSSGNYEIVLEAGTYTTTGGEVTLTYTSRRRAGTIRQILYGGFNAKYLD